MEETPEARISVRVPAAMLRRLERHCAAAEITLEQAVREAIGARLGRETRRAAKRRDRADEPLLAGLRPLVAQVLAEARSWEDLQCALGMQGLAFAPSGGGLALLDIASGRRLCKASEAGPGYSALIRKFRAPFPGHPHAWVAERLLREAACREALVDP